MYIYQIQQVSSGGDQTVIDFVKSKTPKSPHDFIAKAEKLWFPGYAIVVFDDPERRTWEVPSMSTFSDKDSEAFAFLKIVRDA